MHLKSSIKNKLWKKKNNTNSGGDDFWWLCDLEQVKALLWASVFLLRKIRNLPPGDAEGKKSNGQDHLGQCSGGYC